MAPADVGRRLVAGEQALVAVDPLVGHDRDLARVVEQARDELAAGLGELILRARLEERVLVALEEADVGVHARARVRRERLRHEARPDVLAQRDLAHDGAEGHHVVGRGEGVGVAEIDLLLARSALVVAELDRDAHRLEHGDRLTTEVVGARLGRVVEEAAAVDRLRFLPRPRRVLEEVELDLGVGVEGEAAVGGLGEVALEDVPRVGVRRRAVGHLDVAEHPGGRRPLTAPRQDLEGRRVGLGEHVRLVDPGEALDRRAVEADALLEGPLELGRCHRHRLEVAQHVGEPQPHEPHVALLERPQHEVFLLAHGVSLSTPDGLPRPSYPT